MRLKFLVPILVLMVLALPAAPAHAATTLTVCDEAHLLAALAADHAVTFACSGTITLTNPIMVSYGITFDATGQSVTLSGGGLVQIFTVTQTLQLYNITLANGSGVYGGAIENRGTVKLSGVTFTGNYAFYDGGAIANEGGSTTVASSTFSGNHSGRKGGAITNSGTASLTVRSSTFSGNSAPSGGGAIHMRAGTAAFLDDTFYGNNATSGSGGGLFNEGGSVTFTNCTFSANGGSTGGASFSSTAGTTTLVNTIAANRRTSTECVGTLVDGGGNLRYPDKSYPEDICPGKLGNPLLGPLQLNGGTTMTMALGQGSAAIDTALDGPCIGEPILGVDQRGVSRPQGPHCDIGALEQKPYTSSARRIAIDIKPGSDPNSVNCRNANGIITIAILTTPNFDARSVDHTTVSFEGAGETHVDRITGQPIRHEEDVDGDGDVDLVFHFRLGSTYLTCESTSGLLQGYTYAADWFTGANTVRMVNGG